MIARLIDACGDGLLEKSEFEPRISAARARLVKLENEQRQRIGEAAQEAELRLVIGQLEALAGRVSEGLQEPDWDPRREIVRALVKRVEVDEQEVRIVYRVSPSPFEESPQQGRSQHCWGRDHPALWAAGLGVRDAPFLQHPRVEPLADQSQQDAVTYPPAQDLSQVAVVQGVEELAYVDLQDPPAPHLHQPMPECVQRLVRRAP